MLWTNTTFNIAHSNTAHTGTLYFQDKVEKVFYVGQTVPEKSLPAACSTLDAPAHEAWKHSCLGSGG